MSVLILHEHTLIAHALAHYLSQQSGLLVVGAATDAERAIEIAAAEAPVLALLHIECLHREGPRIDEVLGRYQIPSVLLASRDDPRVDKEHDKKETAEFAERCSKAGGHAYFTPGWHSTKLRACCCFDEDCCEEQE